MSDPIKIMEEIERNGLTDDGTPIPSRDQWYELRNEVEAMVERLETSYAYDADGNRIAAPKGMPDGISARDATIEGQEETIKELRARVARLEAVLWDYQYRGDHSEVEDAMYEVLNESEQQSTAHLKAEALREAAEDWEPQPCPLNRPAIREQLRLRADRIEREAKEES